MVRLRLFGAATLEGGDGSVVHSVLAQPKRFALLAYLALGAPRGFVRRDRLLALFWPEKDDAHARNALRQSLHFLRRSLGDGVIATRGDDEVAVDPQALEVDVLDFEALLASGDDAGALEFYGGRLLDGLHLPGMPDLERWVEAERHRLDHLAWQATMDLAAEAMEAGKPTVALAYARRGLELAPSNDFALRMVMTALQGTGDRRGAIEAYEQFARFAAEELDLTPEAETVALAESIRSGDRPGANHPPLPPPPPPPQVAHPPHSAPEGASPLPSPPKRPWRRTVAGAAVAGALAIAAIAAASRSWPGPIADRAPRDARVVLAEFVDATGEVLGPVVAGALRVDLQHSEAVVPVDATEVTRVLGLMGLEPGTPLSPETARALAVREGIPAVLEGSVARAGRGYILSATLRDAASGLVVVAARSDAADPGAVIDAIERLSREIRVRAGESLRGVEAGPPLARVTTGSLEALRFYTQGLAAFGERNDRVLAARLFEQAVALDSTFAMAWRQLSVALQGGVDPSRRTEAVERAYRHRARLSPVERLMVEAHYHQLRGTPGAGREAYQRVLLHDPDNGTALNNLGLLHRMADELDEAAAYLRRAVASPDRNSTAFVNLLDTELSRNRGDQAAAVLHALDTAYPTYELTGGRRFWVAFAQGDLPRAAAHARHLADDSAAAPSDRAKGLTLQAHLAYWAGRLDEGRSLLVQAEALEQRAGPAAAWRYRLLVGYTEALIGDPDWARAWLREGAHAALRLPPHQREHRSAALALAYADDHAGARGFLRDWRDVLAEYPHPDADATLGRTARYVFAEARNPPPGDPLLDFPVATRCEDACWAYPKARYHDVRREVAEALAAYERVRNGGYTNWGPNIAQRLHAMMRLGPLHEAAGDTAQAVEAYRRLAEQWRNGDPRGQAVVRLLRQRIEALGA